MIRWSKHGTVYEADQRRAEVVVRDHGLESAKAAPTAGTREEQKTASVPATSLKVEVVEESPELGTKDARAFRGVAARCNYLAHIILDLQYVTKEAIRRMA